MLCCHLSVLTDYYIRKLIRRYRGRLKSVVAEGASIQADTHTSIDDVLESLYLEPEEIAVQVKKLEVLTRYHQQLELKFPNSHHQLQDLERQIFWLIGFKVLEAQETVAVEHVLDIFWMQDNQKQVMSAAR